MSIRNPIFLLLFCLASSSFCQEKTLKSKIVNKPPDPATAITKTIESINTIRNAEYIWREEFTIPYMPTVFHEPYIARATVSMDQADTLQGAKFKVYALEDTFRLQTIYDGRYIARVNDSGRAYIGDVSQSPSGARNMIGAFHVRVKTWLEQAVKRKADIKVVAINDSLKIEITFNNQQLEFRPGGASIEKDTIGFLSRYTVYVDRHTYLPIKAMRQMPYQTTIETILHQRINAVDTLFISAHDVLKKDSLKDDKPFVEDHTLARRFINTRVSDWKLKEVDSDSVRFSDLKGRKCLIVFNSVGWRPCVQAIAFLKQLRDEHSTSDLALVSIEPFISHAGALKEYKQKHAMNYPLLLADAAMKKHYAVSEVPVFMIVDKHGVIREVITGFYGKGTEAEVRMAIGKR